MTSIGQTLADARRKRKVTVKDVEKAIKIRAKYISALEQDAFDQISGEAYVVGFLKTYAQWLEIDPRPLLDRYREQAGLINKPGQATPDFAAADERSPDRIRKLVYAGIIIGALIVLAAAKFVMLAWPGVSAGR